MASATVLPISGMQHLSMENQTPTTTSTTTELPSTTASNDTVDFWTNLISKNLAIAQAASGEDSDGEASPSAIDEEIMKAPRRKSARDALAHQVAERLYPAPEGSLAPVIKYEKDVVMLRSMYGPLLAFT